VILLVTAASVLLADQISKYLVVTQLEIGQSWNITPWLAPVFSITHVSNTGVAFGLLQGLNDILVGVGIIAIIAIAVYSHRLPQGQWLTRVALGLALGGAIGNLIDRVRQGHVADFIDVNFWPFRDFPVFNVADSSILVGVTILVALLIWEEQRERQRQKEQAAEGG